MMMAALLAATGFAEEVRAVLEPKEQTLITSEVNSTVKAINRRMGQNFKQDEELLLLDDVVFKANLLKAQAQLTKAKTDFESARRLFNDKTISHSDYREAEAALAVAQADLALAEKAYNACFIKAPYTGKVIDVYVKQYERVQPGQNLIAILDDSTLIARVLIPDKYSDTIKIGDAVSVRVQETGTVEEAKIVRIGAIIDPVSSLMKVEAEIPNDSGKLRPGMEGMLIINGNKSTTRP